MSLLSHLNFAFKVMYKLKAGANPQQDLTKVIEIINQFDNVFQRCLLNYEKLVAEMRKVNEVQHIRASLPTVHTDLPVLLMREADKEARRLWTSPNVFSQLLSVHN